MEAVPGDCATRMIAYKNTQGTVITDADIQAEHKLRGLDGAVYKRWGKWVYGLATEEIWDFHVKKSTSSTGFGESIPYFSRCLRTRIYCLPTPWRCHWGDFCYHHDPILG